MLQKIRVRFSRGEELKFISHLDLMRLWERALRRAGVPIAYSQGFSPHPQMSIAAPLSVGMTGEAELMDVVCSRPVTPQWFEDAVNRQLPAGIRVEQAFIIAATLPSLQSQVKFAEYSVKIATKKSSEETSRAISDLMALKTLPWQHQRDTGTKSYDLRPLIDEMYLKGFENDIAEIAMRLRCDSTGTGRPEQVTLALGFSERPDFIHRVRLILENSIEANRKA
jgi:radical SAM-linked protein